MCEIEISQARCNPSSFPSPTFLIRKNLLHHKVLLPERVGSFSILSPSWRSRNNRKGLRSCTVLNRGAKLHRSSLSSLQTTATPGPIIIHHHQSPSIQVIVIPKWAAGRLRTLDLCDCVFTNQNSIRESPWSRSAPLSIFSPIDRSLEYTA